MAVPLIKVLQNTTHFYFSHLMIPTSLTTLPSSKSNLSCKGSRSNSWFEVSLCSYTLNLTFCDVGKGLDNRHSWFLSLAAATNRVHFMCMTLQFVCFCTTYPVKLNKFFKKLLFLMCACLEMAHASYNWSPHFPL